MCPAAQTQQTVPGHRHQPHEGPLRVLVGNLLRPTITIPTPNGSSKSITPPRSSR
jgi:hypothetical protein